MWECPSALGRPGKGGWCLCTAAFQQVQLLPEGTASKSATYPPQARDVGLVTSGRMHGAAPDIQPDENNSVDTQRKSFPPCRNLISHKIKIYLNIINNIYFKPFLYDIVTSLGVCDYRRGMDWILDLFINCIHHSELHFTDHWQRLVYPVYYSLHSPIPGNGF
jgi:hypothetical protein